MLAKGMLCEIIWEYEWLLHFWWETVVDATQNSHSAEMHGLLRLVLQRVLMINALEMDNMGLNFFVWEIQLLERMNFQKQVRTNDVTRSQRPQEHS